MPGAWGGNTTPSPDSEDLTMQVAATKALIDPELEEFNSEVYISDLLDEFLNRNPTQKEIAAVAVVYAESEFLPWEVFLPQLQGKYRDEFLSTLAKYHTAEVLQEAGLPCIR